jgi:uncharacterized membrane protein
MPSPARIRQADLARAVPALPATVRQAVTEWVTRGFVVEVRSDGTIRVEPANLPPADPFDLVDMRP